MQKPRIAARLCEDRGIALEHLIPFLTFLDNIK